MQKNDWLRQQKNLSDRDLKLLNAAWDVLEKNTLQSEDMPWGAAPAISPWSGPCAGLWNWDSVFHAMTVSRFDPALARSCIDCFTQWQLENGMFPDVVHTDGRLSDCSSKPPVLPWGTLRVYEAEADDAFLARNYERFVRNEDYWRRERFDGTLFFYSARCRAEEANYQYPRWESGWDNSPRWDVSPITELYPVDLNCFMVDFYRSMAKAAEYLGKNPALWNLREKEISTRIEELLFDETKQCYLDRNRMTNAFSDVLSPASFMPLFVGTASAARASAMARLACDPRKFYPGMPTVAYDHPAFSTDYWRGQTWLNVAYFAVKGLWDYGFTKTAGEIREFLLSMIFDCLPGIYENYDTVNRRGKFNPSFSWSAAFTIELVLTMRNKH